MYLLLNNSEVISGALCPPADALENACRIFSVPYRYEKAAGVFSAYPPLLGKQILIRSINPDKGSGSRLGMKVASEARLLERLLWISGADVTFQSDSAGRPSEATSDQSLAYRDIALFILPAQAASGQLRPLAVYPWWQVFCSSWSLAGHLSVRETEVGLGFSRVSSLGLVQAVKTRHDKWVAEASAPSVLLSIPLIDGYVEPFLETLGYSVCDAILSHFCAKPIPQHVYTLLEGSARSTSAVSVPAQASTSGLELLPAPTGILSPIPPPPPRGDDERKDGPHAPDERENEVTRTFPLVPAESPPPPPDHIESTPEQRFLKPAVEGNGAPVEGSRDRPMTPMPSQLSSPWERQLAVMTPAGRAAAIRMRGKRGDTPAWALVESVSDNGRETKPAAPPHVISGYSGTSPAIPTPKRLLSKEPDAETESLARLLKESPAAALNHVQEVLSKKGAKPTRDLAEEYLRYVERMVEGGDIGIQ